MLFIYVYGIFALK